MRHAERLYFDNAATSFPKPECVARALTEFSTRLGASPGRGAYAEAREAGDLMRRCRERLNILINGESTDHIIFTLNTTDALNMAIKGLVSADDHVVTTWMDHNSVLRPLNALVESTGIQQTRIQCDPITGIVDPSAIRAAIRPETKLVACVHASNVSGTVQPIAEIGTICREMAVPLLVDAAQTIGHLPIDVQAMQIDLLAFPGHKGLLGPLGTGGLYIRPGMERLLRTTREGGTGSASEQDTQPTNMPDRYESGSHNAPGIIALSEAVDWILSRTVEQIAQHEQTLIRAFLDAIAGAPGVRLLGPQNSDHRVGVFAVRIENMPPAEVSRILEEQYGVLSRSGLHCAPLAHATFSTDPTSHASPDHAGATRLSLGPFLTEHNVLHAARALVEIAARAPHPATPVHS
jgi:cysteine desulfurase family protein